ncbi:MAG: MG2 domain-containing protein, partial [Planctomycetota bacterium]
MIRLHGIALLVMLVIVMLVAGAVIGATGSHRNLLDEARSQYSRQNYKQTLQLAEKVLGDSPADQVLREAQRFKALSLCKLRDSDGYEYSEKIISEHPPFARDGELWEAMGDDRFGRWDRRRAYEYYKKSAEAYEKARKETPAADAYFKAAESLKSGNILPAQRRARTWAQRLKLGIDETLRIYDHITELKIDDERKAKALLLAGRAVRREGSWEYALKGLQRLTKATETYPKTSSAPLGQYEKGEIYEQFNRFVEAVEAYQKAITDFADEQIANRARKRVDEIRAPQITVTTDKPHLPGEKAELFWRIRNVKRLDLTAYEVDLLEGVARLKGVRPSIKELAKSKGREIASWTFLTPDEGKHQFHSRLPHTQEKQTTEMIGVPFKQTGAYLVRARGVNLENRPSESWCLLIFSNLSAVTKADTDQALVFVSHAVTGKPVNSADVALSRWSPAAYQTTTTNDAGITEIKFPADRSHGWIVAARKDRDQAICAPGRYHWYWWGYGGLYKVYGFTARPVYRPGQRVNFKQIIRVHKEGAYENLPDAKVRVEVRDPRGETIYAKDHVTDEFGALEGSLTIEKDAPLGVYSINVSMKGRRIGRDAVGNRFRVEEYKKPEFKVAVEPDRADYRIGDEMKIKISARYYFGEPVVDAHVSYRIRKLEYTHRYVSPRRWAWYYERVYGTVDWRAWRHDELDEVVEMGTAKTDENGEAFVTVMASPIKHREKADLKFIVDVDVIDAARRSIRGRSEVKVTHAPFFIYPTPAQGVYGPGDSVEINIRTENPNGEPVGGAFTVEAWRIERIRKVLDKDGQKKVEFEEKLAQKVFSQEIDIPQTGRHRVRFTPDATGHFKVIVKQVNVKDAQPVEGSCKLWVASRTGAEQHYAYNDLQIVPAGDQYEIGESMKLLVNTAKSDSYVLLSGEAAELLFHRVVHVAGNSVLVELPVSRNLTPNFTLTATMLRDNKVYRDSKNIIVPPTHQFLKVDVQSGAGSMGGGEDNTYQPREQMRIRIRVTDMQTGEPVVGQLAVMLVDSSIYYIQPEFREAIEKAFYGYVRSVRVATNDSFAGPVSLNPPLGRHRDRRRFAKGAMVEEGFMDAAAPAPMKATPAEAREDKEEALAETIIREDFRDTVLWTGSVITDADGTAEIPATLPDQLTTFALHAISFDKQTRVGQGRADVVTTKRIIARLASPRFFTEGDQSYVTVIAHNYFDEPQDLKVALSATENLQLLKVKMGDQWRDYQTDESLDVTVPGGGEVRVDFMAKALRAGEVQLL